MENLFPDSIKIVKIIFFSTRILKTNFKKKCEHFNYFKFFSSLTSWFRSYLFILEHIFLTKTIQFNFTFWTLRGYLSYINKLLAYFLAFLLLNHVFNFNSNSVVSEMNTCSRRNQWLTPWLTQKTFIYQFSDFISVLFCFILFATFVQVFGRRHGK